MNISDHDYLWRDKDGGWALSRLRPVPGEREPQFVIVNLRTRMAVVIEDDDVYAAVKQEMLRRGVPIVGPGEL